MIERRSSPLLKRRDRHPPLHRRSNPLSGTSTNQNLALTLCVCKCKLMFSRD
jgi:hypothetical protein